MDKDLHTFVGTKLIQDTWEDIVLEVGGSYSLGDFQAYRGEVTEALRKSLFIMPKYLLGSDYSGDLVNKSNHRVFLERFGKVEGVYETYGGYGSFGIVIRLDVYNSNEEIKEVIDGLEEYCIIDEEDHSALEYEADQELVTEVAKDLSRDIDLEDYIPDIDIILENTNQLEEYIWNATEDLQLEFEHEQHYAFIRDKGRIKLYVEDRLIIEHAKQLPLFINREWSCKKTKQMYKDKLSK
jgi:hypothetical protein